jgi:hypothetical protein
LHRRLLGLRLEWEQHQRVGGGGRRGSEHAGENREREAGAELFEDEHGLPPVADHWSGKGGGRFNGSGSISRYNASR